MMARMRGKKERGDPPTQNMNTQLRVKREQGITDPKAKKMML